MVQDLVKVCSRKLLKGGGLKVVNSDDIYEYLMAKQGLPMDPETIFSPQGQEIRDKAKDMTEIRRGGFLDGRLGLTIDGTGKDTVKLQKESDKLREYGYETMMIFVNTSLEVAQERNLARKRKLAPEKVEQMWNLSSREHNEIPANIWCSNFHIVDNSGGLEDP